MAEMLKIKAVQRGLRKTQAKHAKGWARGLKVAGLFLQRLSQKIVPLDTAALKNSAGTRAEGEGFQTVVIVFYTMFYAVYVHENLWHAHAFPTQAKFLEQPARENRNEILHLVWQEVAR